MRYVPAGQRHAEDSAALMIAMFVAAAAAVAAGARKPDWGTLLVGFLATAGALPALAYQWREVQRSPLVRVGDLRSRFRPPPVVLVATAGVGSAMALVGPEQTLGAAIGLFVVAPCLAAVHAWWLADFERRTGMRVYRDAQSWWRARYVLHYVGGARR